MPPSLAREMYDRITKDPDPAGVILSFIGSNPPTDETDWLDFKRPPEADKLRALWIKILCGFANNQGGVIVWGVDCRKNPATGVDAADSSHPLDTPHAFKSRLVELQRAATDPPIGNVEIQVCELVGESGKGFVVCFVPEGPYKPYRTEDRKASQFWVRLGDSFEVLSRPMIQAMFYPRLKVQFGVSVDLSWEFVRDDEVIKGAEVIATLAITNKGRATARNTHLLIEDDGRLSREPGNISCLKGWEKRNHVLASTFPLHPNSPPLKACRITWPTGHHYNSAGPHNRGPNIPSKCRMSFVLYSEDQEPQHFAVIANVDELDILVARGHITLVGTLREV